MSGKDVQALQEFLLERGFTISGGSTGYFGLQTEQALIAFQSLHSIAPASGYFGPKTQAVVNGALPVIVVGKDAPQAEPVLPSLFLHDLKRGDSGDDVKALQEFLTRQNVGPAARVLMEAGITKFFGALTKNALIEFQQANNILPPAGYFGPKTRAFFESIENLNLE